MTTQPTPAEIRLAQYADRSTWTNATYDSGTEKALHEIALGLKSEIDRLRSEVADQQAETEKLIRWHREDETAMKKMRGTIERLRGEKRELGELAARRESELLALRPRVAESERPAADAPDTLPAWLANRFDPNGAPWDGMSDDDRAYWERQARAVRRAVARGGFKPEGDRAAAVGSV